MNDLISVIIPVYKVELYLERCVNSVFRQTYQNIEIILVDDGSPDACGAMCDALATKDDRVKVYHKENGGLSDARNYGVINSNGKYIAFIDSDDYVAPNYIEYLYTILQKNNADISCCCMVKTENDAVEYSADNTLPVEQVLSSLEACERMFDDLYMTLVTAWGKLYKQEIVQKYPFPKGKKHEDEATTCKYYYESNRVVVGNQCLYAYYQNPTSITHSQADKLNVDVIWALEHKAQFFENCKETKLAQIAWEQYFYYCVKDSLKHSGRCDLYLTNFVSKKSLTKRLALEAKLYNGSRLGFKMYLNGRNILSKLKQVVLHRK